MLLDPLEEQLDLPAAAIQLGDGQGRQREVVGEEARGLAAFAVVELDAPKLVGIAGRGRDTGEDNGLIANDPGRPVGRMRIKPAELGIGFGLQDEEAAGRGGGRSPGRPGP